MPTSDAELEIALLKDRIAELERELTTLRHGWPHGENIQRRMSAEVVDSNPYKSVVGGVTDLGAMTTIDNSLLT